MKLIHGHLYCRSGTLYGVTSGFGNLSGFCVPYIVLAITGGNEHDAAAWRWIFFLSSGLFVLETIFFVALASDKIQYFDTKSYKKLSLKKNKEDNEDILK